jgi:hypothetical protein
MNSRFRCLLLLFLCLAAALPAGGKKEKAPVVRAAGRVRLVGSAPLSELVITGPDREWHIVKEEEQKLFDLQQRTVTVEGEETVVQLKFANGMSAGERRTLKNIKIIAIE